MKRITIISILAAVIFSVTSCTKDDEMCFAKNNGCYETSAVFNVSVADMVAHTKASYLKDNNAGLDDNVAFGLVGTEINNMGVFADNGVRSAEIVTGNSNSAAVSAYYPYVGDVDCQEDGTSIITFTVEDFKKGPMVSNDFEINFDQSSNVVNLQFHHIADRIGFNILDITDDEQLANLVHIREVLLYGAAVQGVYVNSENPYWIPQYARKPYSVFNGNSRLEQDGIMTDRFYVVPENMDEKYVEVIFDVDGFDYNGSHYNASAEKVMRISLADIQPDEENTYTLGLDLAEVYQTIEFSAGVADWENETVIE